MITTSPPASVHLIGAIAKRATGVALGRRPARLARRAPAPPRREPARAREGVDRGARGRGSSRAAPTGSWRSPTRSPTRRVRCGRSGPVTTIANGSDFDDFDGLEYRPGERFRITHTGSFFGKRDPAAVPDRARASRGSTSRRASWATSARPTGTGPRSSGSATGSALLPYAPRRESLELQRDSEALLLLIPDAGGRGKGVLSGKVFEYLAAERPILAVVPPDGAAADLIRETGAGVVAAPDDVDGHPARRSAELEALLARRHAGRDAALGRVAASASRGGRGRRSTPSFLRGGVRGDASTASPPSSSWPRSSRSRSRRCTGSSPARSASPTSWRCSSSATFLAGRWLEHDGRLPRTALVALGFALAFALVYLIGFFNLDTRQALEQFAKGLVKFGIHFAFLAAGIAYLARRGRDFYWRTLGVVHGRAWRSNALYGVAQLVAANRGQDLDQAVLAPLTGGASSINIYGAVEGADVYRPNALTGDPNHLGDDAARPAARADADLPAARAGPPLADAARGPAAVPARDGAGDAVAQRLARARGRAARARRPVPAPARLARAADPARRRARRCWP